MKSHTVVVVVALGSDALDDKYFVDPTVVVDAASFGLESGLVYYSVLHLGKTPVVAVAVVVAFVVVVADTGWSSLILNLLIEFVVVVVLL